MVQMSHRAEPAFDGKNHEFKDFLRLDKFFRNQTANSHIFTHFYPPKRENEGQTRKKSPF